MTLSSDSVKLAIFVVSLKYYFGIYDSYVNDLPRRIPEGEVLLSMLIVPSGHLSITRFGSFFYYSVGSVLLPTRPTKSLAVEP